VFCQAPDPDYPDALLLEQHQAPITAALTPAFSPDSTPEILSSAIDACAVFVGCGVVKDVSRMGRILKQLTTALGEVDGKHIQYLIYNDIHAFQESGNLTMGNFVDLSPNASGMLRVSVLSAWARLEIASSEQTYLLDVIKPYRSILAPQWIASLRDYAVIRADSEFIHDASAVALDPSYASLGKVVLLPVSFNPIDRLLSTNITFSVLRFVLGNDSASCRERHEPLRSIHFSCYPWEGGVIC
jgi:hypothetical protein